MAENPEEGREQPRQDEGWERRQRRHEGRKEHVLHTRISDDLADDIRRLADDLRVPVSNLVRNVLEEAFSVVETVTDNVGDLVDEVVEEASRARTRIRRRRAGARRHSMRAPKDDYEAERESFPDVLGWQPLILNRPQSCADCEEPIQSGEKAFAGMGSAGLTPHYLCGDCAAARER